MLSLRIGSVAFLTTLLAVLTACSNAGGVGALSAVSRDAEAVPRLGCPPAPSPGTATITSLDFVVNARFAIGTRSTVRVALLARDLNGNAISGTYANPISLAVEDSNRTHPRVRFDCPRIYSSQQGASLEYSGEGDRFTLTASAAGGISRSHAFVTTLPKEFALAREISQTSCCNDEPFGMAALGSDGNIWSSLRWANRNSGLTVVGRITPGGEVTKFVVRGTAPEISGELGRGGDGNLYLPVTITKTGRGALARITRQGVISFIEGAVDPNSMAADSHGGTWFSIDTGSNTGTIVRVTSDGQTSTIASLKETPYSLVADPLGRGMWFGTNAHIGLVTFSGKVTLYAVPGAQYFDPIQFFMGSDGKFWAPWIFRDALLMKFDTKGHIDSWTPLQPANGSALRLDSVALDRSGNAFIPNQDDCSVIRLTPEGKTSEYATYACTEARVGTGIFGVVAGRDGFIYITDVASNAKGNLFAGGLIKLDPRQW